ncbi:MAG: hypothetical protein ACFE96_17445 [Candidatus Hermodarchaeota archaeon]
MKDDRLRKIKINTIKERFLQLIFNCELHQLTQIFGLIVDFEQEYKCDLVQNLTTNISERDSEFSLSYRKDYCEEFLYYILAEHSDRYMSKCGISKDNGFMEFIYEELICEKLTDASDPDFTFALELDECLSEYGISSEIYNGLLKILNSVLKRYTY